jgi:hypothetical protein
MMANTLLEAIVREKFAAEVEAARVTFPTSKYRYDPVGFCISVLGFAPTSRQILILEAVRDHQRVAIPSGRKTGKSRSLAAIALWWFCCWDDATVVIVAPCERQITEVTWYDLVGLFHASGRCLACAVRDPDGPRPCEHATPVDGELSASVRSGLRQGQRRVIGLAPRNSDNARGISGPHQLWLVDEASGVARAIYEAADGNRAAGAKLVVAGQPTSRATWFYDACERLGFHVIRIASTSSPNVTMGRVVVPGLASISWVDEKREDWGGEDDPRFQIEVLGLFPTREDLRLINDEEFSACNERHEAVDLAKVQGPLFVGIDPAGGRGADKSAIVLRRGGVVLAMLAFNGATDVIMSELDIQLRKFRRTPTEPVTVNFDAHSDFGAELGRALHDRKIKSDDALTYNPLTMKGDPKTNPALRDSRCSRLVDAMYLNLSIRLKSDAAVPFDATLREELLFWEFQADREVEGSQLISKRAFRRALGRSPDLSDALAFCFWEGRVAPGSDITRRIAAERAARNAEPEEPEEPEGPYAWHEPRGPQHPVDVDIYYLHELQRRRGRDDDD